MVFLVIGDTSGRAEMKEETSEGHHVGKYDNKWEVRGHRGRFSRGVPCRKCTGTYRCFLLILKSDFKTLIH